MDNFKDMMKAKEKSRPKLPEFRGTFLCQQCGEFVDVAQYDRQKGVLIWLCSLGHGSSIEWEI